MQNPFTATSSRIPDRSYVPTGREDVIIENFRFDSPSESLYKITGVRGSGKTVLLARIEAALSEEEFRNRGWMVCRITPARDMITQLMTILSRDRQSGKQAKKRSVNVVDEKSSSRKELEEKMEKPGNYPVYRDRLLRRGLVRAQRGSLTLSLPCFGEYMAEYCGE